MTIDNAVLVLSPEVAIALGAGLATWPLFRLLEWTERRIRSRLKRPDLTPFGGKLYVIDGDTVQVGSARIRLFGMDAPELTQRGGQKAKSHLIRLAGGREVCVLPTGVDCYGRIVGRIRFQDVDLSERMVHDGYAVATVKWHTDYATAERTARAGRHGLWAEKGIGDPAAFRRWKKACGLGNESRRQRR